MYRDINDFKKGYQPRTIIVKGEKGDLVADSHSEMARWRNYFSQLLNLHGINDVRQAEMQTAEPLVPGPSAFEFEVAIEKLKSHKLHNEELSDLYSLPNIVRVVKSRRLGWAGHVARMVEGRGVHRVLVGKPEGKRPLGETQT